nr:immunoglobulin heavy chain junction region [Mus musculus]
TVQEEGITTVVATGTSMS